MVNMSETKSFNLNLFVNDLLIKIKMYFYILMKIKQCNSLIFH